MSEENVVIVAARRTPIGSFQGTLSTVPAPDLGEQNHALAFHGCITVKRLRCKLDRPDSARVALEQPPALGQFLGRYDAGWCQVVAF